MTNVLENSDKLDVRKTVKNLTEKFDYIDDDFLVWILKDNKYLIDTVFDKIWKENVSLENLSTNDEIYYETIEDSLDTGVYLTMAYIDAENLTIMGVNDKKIDLANYEVEPYDDEDLENLDKEEDAKSYLSLFMETSFGVLLKKENGELTIKYCSQEPGSAHPPIPPMAEEFTAYDTIMEQVIECINEGLIFKED